MPLRLPLLHQPALEQRAARAFHAGRSGGAHARFLQTQLHRGALPQQRHHPQRGLHDGVGHRGRAEAAGGTSLSRLHPPQDDSRGVARAHRNGGALRGPHQHQYRTAHAGGTSETRAGKKPRAHAGCDGSYPRKNRRATRGKAEAGCAEAPAFCDWAKHADARGRG